MPLLNNEFDVSDTEPTDRPSKVEIAKSKFICEFCEKGFNRKEYLKSHRESVHLGYKFPCNLCNYEATAKRSLQTHIESKHEGKKYPCPQCKMEICVALFDISI